MVTRNIRRPGHRGLRGYFPSFKIGRALAFESRLERDLFLLLEADPAVRAYEEQPVTLDFAGHKRARKYTPDVRVDYHARASELVEVKYAEDLATLDAEERAAMEEAHAAARRWCADRGWIFVVRTNHDILGPELDRAMALRAFARAPSPENDLCRAVRALVTSRPGVALGELPRAFSAPAEGDLARRWALHLLWRCELRDEPFATPTDATRLYRTELAR